MIQREVYLAKFHPQQFRSSLLRMQTDPGCQWNKKIKCLMWSWCDPFGGQWPMAITSNLQQNTANQDWVSIPCPLRYGEVPNFSNTLLLSRGTLPPTQGGWVCHRGLKHLGEFDQSSSHWGQPLNPQLPQFRKSQFATRKLGKDSQNLCPKATLTSRKVSFFSYDSQVCFIYRHFEKPSALIMRDIISPYKSPFVQKALYVGLRRATRPSASWWFFSTHPQKIVGPNR